MALKKFQKKLELNTLYEVSKDGGSNYTEQIRTNFSVNSGGVNVYGYNGENVPTSLADMTLNSENADVKGITAFGIIPRYIYIEQFEGTTTEIIVSGLNVTDLGGF